MGIHLLLLALICNYCYTGWGLKLPMKFQFDSIYQFGDSTSDTGNLMKEISIFAPCSHNPYGETYFHKPSGRFSDGLILVAYFAKAFNLPFLNPYLEKKANFSHGVNFAVAGATAFNITTNPISTLSDQIQWFHAYANSTCSSPSCSPSKNSFGSKRKEDCKKKFKKALFIMGEIGLNNYNYVLLANKSISSAYSLVPRVIQPIKQAVKDVIDHGAIHIVVPGSFPIGCIPNVLIAFKSNKSREYNNLGCLRSLNKLAKFHNRNLKHALKELQIEYPSVKIHYGDYYSGSKWIFNHAASLGFDKDKFFKPCCGNKTHPCGEGDDAPVCRNPSKRMSWDGTHPTQEAYKNLAEWILSKTFTRIAPSPSSSHSPSR